MTRLVMLLKGWCVTGVLAAICNYIYTLRMNNPAKVGRLLKRSPACC